MNSLSFIVNIEQRVKQIRDNNILNKRLNIQLENKTECGELIVIGDSFIIIKPTFGLPVTIELKDILFMTWK